MSADSIFNIAPSSLKVGAVLARGPPGITLCTAELELAHCTLKVAVQRLNTSQAPTESEFAFLKGVQVLQLASATCHRVCRMLGCCRLDGDPCIVMALYSKSAARHLDAAQGPLSMPELISMGVEILEGLAQLHAINIWHLDLKPGNIWLDEYGHAYLSGFGMSYALRTLEACTQYVAPEQADPELGSESAHTDVWGFAACILHMATGKQPYQEESTVQMNTAMSKQRPPCVPSILPPWLHQLLVQCFNFEAALRPSITHLLQVFQEQLKQQSCVVAQVGTASEGTYASVATQLQSGEAMTQEQAARTVWTLTAAAHSIRTLTPSLVALLTSHQLSVQKAAAGALNTLALCPEVDANYIIETDAVPLLVGLLRSDKPAVQEHALGALRNLAYSSLQIAKAIIAAGVVPLLTALLRSDTAVVQVEAAGALADFACRSYRAEEAIIAAGAIPLLTALLGSKQPAVQEEAAATVAALLNYSQHSKDAIVAAGAVPLLTAFLSSEQPVYMQAEFAVLRLAKGTQQNQDAIIAAGAVPLVVALLRSDRPADRQSSAAFILWTLAKGSQQNKDAIIAAGAVPLFVALLMSDQSGVSSSAAFAFKALADGSQENKDAIIAAGAVPLLAALCLSDRFIPAANTIAGKVLESLAAGSQQNRDAIISAGYQLRTGSGLTLH